ncbi:hypothetical protein NPIL_329211 [Nephila pilipes]|uniref:Uncharacterized protein n=1 Tax=Nephila pilipes TaxID=299642 RepID=A0A8X6QFE5_NEPPI|nr:hypothetical protein NPIL_329211 [Nephila pilipes]
MSNPGARLFTPKTPLPRCCALWCLRSATPADRLPPATRLSKPPSSHHISRAWDVMPSRKHSGAHDGIKVVNRSPRRQPRPC